MTEREQLLQLCEDGLKSKNLTDAQYKNRIELEVKEIDAQAEYEYLLDLHNKGAKFAQNENNLLVAYLLGLCDDFDIARPPIYVQGEFPDIDMDYLPLVRDYLKNEWAPRAFGRENICSISTYGTLGIRMALLDATKVYGIPKDEIQAITKNIDDKDDDNKDMTWDKAFELYPLLADYCKRHPEVADAAKALTDRNKSGGVHAGGLIISSKPIADFVPLETRSVTKENPLGVIVSAWTEGQATQDLQPVGLVKFDLLVVDGLKQIAQTCKLIRERHGLDRIWALPGQRNWSDTSFLNDPAALALANKGDTTCIFQFGSAGIQKLIKKGGVHSFDDIASYSALYRPGPLGMGMAERYCQRKRGNEKYEIHPLMRPFLSKTYGVLVFQEQVIQILHAVGGIPLIHCEKVRKAISKKKIAQFIKYKEMFLKNGQKNLGESLEYVQDLWDQIEAFADYGFNASHAYAYSYISAMQLCLKAHYPLEFYTAVFMCEDKSDKIKEYKIDAKKHGIELMPINLNKSKKNFSIVDDKIYYGFSNLKYFGEATAERIVEQQPYQSITDFIERFGADATVLKGLICLGAFDDSKDRYKLFKFFEYYKNTHVSQKNCTKTHKEALEKYRNDLLVLLQTHCSDPAIIEQCNRFDDGVEDLWHQHFGHVELDEEYRYKGDVRTRKVSVAKLLTKVKNRVESSIRNYQEKEKYAKESPPDFKSFPADRVKLDEKAVALLSTDTKEAERYFYGFQWVHELEESPDYEGFTIDRYNQAVEQGDETCVEVKILQSLRKEFKSGKGHAFDLQVEDANGKIIWVKFWSDDYERFEEDLKVGGLVRMRIKPPLGNFSTYSFEAPQRHLRWKVLPKDKNEDYRLVVLRRPEKKPVVEEKKATDTGSVTFIDLENLK